YLITRPAPSSTHFPYTSLFRSLTISKAFTTTTLVSSLNPSTYGQIVTFTATVTANSPSTINPASTGSVMFMDGSTTLCSAVAIVNSYNKTTCINNYTADGRRGGIAAIYSGDTNDFTKPA